MDDKTPTNNPTLHENHARSFRTQQYVYPVLSRRAGGISIGVNLNRDKTCNFNCVYCQVDRTADAAEHACGGPVDLQQLEHELLRMIDLVLSGRIYEETKFRETPEPLRRLNDVALSGNGEPTARPEFAPVMDLCADVFARRKLDGVKLVLITNASLLHRPGVRRGLEQLDAIGGEIWAKLDAGTEAYYRQVARAHVPFGRILENLREAAQARPIVIQSLWMRIHGQPPPPSEQQAYRDRLSEILASGGSIKVVQLHTIARPPAESWASALSRAEVDQIATLVRQSTGLPVACSYGPTA